MEPCILHETLETRAKAKGSRRGSTRSNTLGKDEMKAKLRGETESPRSTPKKKHSMGVPPATTRDRKHSVDSERQKDSPATPKLLRTGSEFLKDTAAMLAVSGKHPPSTYAKATVFETKNNRVLAEFKTSVQKRTVTPVWNESFQLLVENTDLSSLQLKLEIFQRRSLGNCLIPLFGLLQGDVASAFPLKAAERTLNSGGGEIYVSLSFTSELRATRTSVTSVPTLAAPALASPPRQSSQARARYRFDGNISQETMRFEWVGDSRYTVTAASLVKLVELMTWPESALGTGARYDARKLIGEVAVVRPMLCSWGALLHLLVSRYRGPQREDEPEIMPRQLEVFRENSSEIQAGVLSALQEMFSTTSVMAKDPSVAKELRKAAEEARQWAVLGDPLRALLESFETLSAEISRVRANAAPLELRNTLKSVSTASIVLELRVTDIAEQWCLMEHAMFCSIRTEELMHQAWAKRPEQCLGMNGYTEWVNRMARWVASEVIQQSTAAQRGLIIGNFIEIALLLRQLNNIGGMMEILAGLSIAAVDRLRDSWELVPSQLKNSHRALEKLLSAKSNFRMYRELMAIAVPPYVPFIGTHLTDLTYIDEGNATMIAPDLFNVEKLELVAATIQVFDRAAQKPYPFKPMQSVQQEMKSVRALDEEELYRLSLMREPRRDANVAISPRRGGGTKIFRRKHRKKTVLRSAFNTNTEFFQVTDLSSKDIDFLFSGCKIVPLSQGQALCYERDYVDFCFVVVRGELYTESQVGGGSDTAVTLYSRGELVLGMGALFEKYVVPYTIRAAHNGCSIKRVKFSAVHAMLQHKPELAQRFYLKLARHLGNDLDELNTSKGIPTATRRQLYPLQSPSDSIKSIQREFSLPPEDVAVVEEFPAAWNTEQGTLYITGTAVCFKCTIFQAVTRTVTTISAIQNMQLRKAILVLQITEPKPHTLEYDLMNHASALRALSVLQTRKQTRDGPEVPAYIHRNKSLDSLDAFDAITLVRTGPKNISISMQGASPLHFVLSSAAGGDAEVALTKLAGYFERMVDPQRTTEDRIAPKSARVAEERKSSLTFRGGLTVDDWTLILAGAHSKKLVKGDVVLQYGTPMEALYRVDAGSCEVVSPEGTTLARIPQGEIFGETSFLHGAGYTPNVNVVVSSDECALTMIHHHFLGILFSMQPGVAGRFFNHLCYVLMGRVLAMLEKKYVKEKQQQELAKSSQAQLYGKQKIPKFVLKTPVKVERATSPVIPPEMLAPSPSSKGALFGDQEEDEVVLQVSEDSSTDTSEELEQAVRAAANRSPTSHFPGIRLRKKNSLFSMSMENLDEELRE